jgi:hypothetical protein
MRHYKLTLFSYYYAFSIFDSLPNALELKTKVKAHLYFLHIIRTYGDFRLLCGRKYHDCELCIFIILCDFNKEFKHVLIQDGSE